LPVLERNTLPLAVILNRFATDFFVFLALGRRINQTCFLKDEEFIRKIKIMQEIILNNRIFF